MIKYIKIENNVAKIKVEDVLENSLLALKIYLNQEKDVVLAGIQKEHYLEKEVFFVVKVKEGKDPKEVIKKVIEKAVKDLDNLKIKE